MSHSRKRHPEQREGSAGSDTVPTMHSDPARELLRALEVPPWSRHED